MLRIAVLRSLRLNAAAFFGLIGLIALGVMPGTSSGQSKIDCAGAYKAYLEQLKRKEISRERRAALHRWGMRVYDACETGDLGDVKGLFERLDRQSY